MTRNQSPAGPFNAAVIEALTGLVVAAGAAILAIRSGGAIVRLKADSSPVTDADEAANAVLLDGLGHLLPDWPVLSEETAGPVTDLARGRYLVIDPLDGTREFVDGRDEFTVNLAAVVDGAPVFGIVSAPACGRLWRSAAAGGAERLAFGDGPVERPEAIRTRPCPQAGIVAAVSRSHGDATTCGWLDRLRITERRVCGSAVKLACVAEGSVDVYPRLGPTSAWDIAAGHAVVAAAGGVLTTPGGTPLRYGGPTHIVPGFIAWGDRTAAARLGPVTE